MKKILSRNNDHYSAEILFSRTQMGWIQELPPKLNSETSKIDELNTVSIYRIFPGTTRSKDLKDMYQKKKNFHSHI